MEFTNTHYCQITRWHLKFLGQWPNQDPMDRGRRIIFIVFIIIIEVITTVWKYVRSFRELDMFEAIPLCITTLVCYLKLLSLVLCRERLEYLQSQINSDYKERTSEKELEIMERYWSQGKQYAKGYMYFLYTATAVYCGFVFETRLLDIISPRNETRPYKFIYPAYFALDEHKYYYLISVFLSGYILLDIITFIGFDTMLIMYAQYICGLLAFIGNQLEYELYKCTKDGEPIEHQRRAYKSIIEDSVRTHRKTLHFVNRLDSAFMLPQLLQLGLNMIFLSISLVKLNAVFGTFETFRHSIYIMGQLIHLLYICYQSERLIDHSLAISQNAYNGQWYNIPTETQKMLMLISRRSSIPSYVTAGKIFIFSMQSFSMVIQNSMSYFMALTSLQ